MNKKTVQGEKVDLFRSWTKRHRLRRCHGPDHERGSSTAVVRRLGPGRTRSDGGGRRSRLPSRGEPHRSGDPRRSAGSMGDERPAIEAVSRIGSTDRTSPGESSRPRPAKGSASICSDRPRRHARPSRPRSSAASPTPSSPTSSRTGSVTPPRKRMRPTRPGSMRPGPVWCWSAGVAPARSAGSPGIRGRVDAAMLAVGAAFDYGAGNSDVTAGVDAAIGSAMALPPRSGTQPFVAPLPGDEQQVPLSLRSSPASPSAHGLLSTSPCQT